MSRPRREERHIGRWIGVFFLIVAMPLFIRAASVAPQYDGTQPQAAAAQATAPAAAAPDATATALVRVSSTSVSTPPRPEVMDGEANVGFSGHLGATATATAAATQTAVQTATPAPTATPSSTPTQAPTAVPTETPAPTDPPGTWTYSTSTIDVTITRHQQDDFVYFAADIQLTDPSQFTYAFSNEKYDARTEALSDIAARHDPLVAINGDYYSFHGNGIIIRGGELYRKNKSTRHLLIVDKNGDFSVMTDRSEKQAQVAARLQEEGVLHTFEFGPLLVENSEAVTLNSTILRVGTGYLEPRTAIGQLGPLHYLVIVVDGRSEGYSAGCDLPTLQQLFLDFGAQTAFNLDGGGSTTLWFDGEVINHPASGDERKVSDIIMFMRD